MIIRSTHAASKAIRHFSTGPTPRLLSALSHHHRAPITGTVKPQNQPFHPFHPKIITPTTATATTCIRLYSSNPSPPSPSPTADEVMTQLTELYSTAKDEFEIAAEETEKKSVCAEDDRAAAHEALDALKEAYAEVVGSQKKEADGGDEVGKEVERRVGPRIRELETAVKNLDDLAMED